MCSHDMEDPFSAESSCLLSFMAAQLLEQQWHPEYKV